MTNELLSLFEYYEVEKGIKRDVMVEALETALLSALRKKIGPAREMRIKVDADKGDIKAFSTLIVKDRVENPYEEIDIFTARRIDPTINVEDEIELNITPADLGRIAAQTAKQTMLQRLRQAEKENMYDEFKDRAGDIVSGVVRRFERGDVWIDLGKFEGVMPQRERVSTEEYNPGDRIRVYVVAVENGSRGPEIILSRSHPNFVRRLFESEVSEIADRTVEIRSLAREPGFRTKVAVHSADRKVDPVGACVGLRGARVKNIVNELNKEKVDIIRYDEDLNAFVEDALKPAKINDMTIDEETRTVRVFVDEEELSKAIGRRGQNVRLTTRLVGWDVQVQKDESAQEAFKAQIAKAVKEIAAVGIDEEHAEGLVQGGVNSLTMLANDVDEVDIADILSIGVEEAKVISDQAQAAIARGEEKEAEETADAEEEKNEASEEAEAPGEEGAAAKAEETADSEDQPAPVEKSSSKDEPQSTQQPPVAETAGAAESGG